jgi:hypothetical protein
MEEWAMAKRVILKNAGKSAIANDKSKNSKTGEIAVTTASLETCPTRCGFKNNGCMAQNYPLAFTVNRLDKAFTTPLQAALDEAEGIRKLDGTAVIRLHQAGDCSTDEAAQIVSAAADEYTAKQGKPAFTYTHAWPDVDRASWGGVSVLASCETPEQVAEARARGYATAMVIEELPSKPIALACGGIGLPCPEQAGIVKSCGTCGGGTPLCSRDQTLREKQLTILFHGHGPTTKVEALKAALARANA